MVPGRLGSGNRLEWVARFLPVVLGFLHCGGPGWPPRLPAPVHPSVVILSMFTAGPSILLVGPLPGQSEWGRQWQTRASFPFLRSVGFTQDSSYLPGFLPKFLSITAEHVCSTCLFPVLCPRLPSPGSCSLVAVGDSCLFPALDNVL